MADDIDVLIVGAGLSGIGAAVHLRRNCPDRSFALLERRQAIGGTWDIFRYPGIRSDSDMHTLGYSFKPWREAKAIADGPSIRNYVRETAAEYNIEQLIRYGHKVVSADWDSSTSRWTVEAQLEDGTTTRIQANFLLMCSGYYSYDRGHMPEFPGQASFNGPIICPQFWPEDLDYRGKNVVVIGSGATAMTLVPSMARDGAQVTMLQRSPTYVVSRPSRDRIANFLRKVLPDRWAYAITRFKNTTMQQLLYRRTRTAPEKVRDRLLGWVRDELGPDYDVEKHFTPSYNPWDQRLCLVPDSDLFQVLRDGSARIVTDHIATFNERGILLESGEQLDADIIVSATGLELVVMGDARFSVDGEPVDFSRKWTYKGLMASDVPNMVVTFGYINASWTLRADLTHEWVCRVLNHMRDTGTTQVTPRLPPALADMPSRLWIDDFSPGYMERVMHLFPRQGDREPWINPQDYRKDRKMFRRGELEDGALQFTTAPGPEEQVVSNPAVKAA